MEKQSYGAGVVFMDWLQDLGITLLAALGTLIVALPIIAVVSLSGSSK